MQVTNLESQEIWAVPSGLVSVHYSPSAHTWEQMDLNFHLPHLGLPTSIPCSIVSLPIIRALFNMYWGEKKEGLWGQVGARLRLQGYFCLLGAQGERSWLSGISLAVSAPRSGTARAGVLGPPSFLCAGEHLPSAFTQGSGVPVPHNSLSCSGNPSPPGRTGLRPSLP